MPFESTVSGLDLPRNDPDVDEVGRHAVLVDEAVTSRGSAGFVDALRCGPAGHPR
jgi:hypothetical protein